MCARSKWTRSSTWTSISAARNTAANSITSSWHNFLLLQLPVQKIYIDFDFPVKSYTDLYRNVPEPTVVHRPPQQQQQQHSIWDSPVPPTPRPTTQPVTTRPVPAPTTTSRQTAQASTSRPTTPTPSTSRQPATATPTPKPTTPSPRPMPTLTAQPSITAAPTRHPTPSPRATVTPVPTSSSLSSSRPVATVSLPVAIPTSSPPLRSWSSVVRYGIQIPTTAATQTTTPSPPTTSRPTAPAPPSKWEGMTARSLIRPPPTTTATPSTPTPAPTMSTSTGWTKMPVKRKIEETPKVNTPLPTTAATTSHKVKKQSPPTSTGWLKADKSDYKVKKTFKCDLCGTMIDSVCNLHAHRNSRRCRENQPPSPIVFNSPPLDPEPYIIRNRPFRREIVDLEETNLPVSPITSQPIFNGVDLDETVLPSQYNVEEDQPEANPQQQAEVYTCNECEAEFLTVQALIEHANHCRKADSEEDDDEQQEFNCGQCEGMFRDLFSLREHRRGCHPDSMQDMKQLCNNFNCQDCRLNQETVVLEVDSEVFW